MEQWPAYEHWTPDYLARTLAVKLPAKSNTSPVFKPGCCAVKSTEPRTFFEHVTSAKSKEYWYDSCSFALHPCRVHHCPHRYVSVPLQNLGKAARAIPSENFRVKDAYDNDDVVSSSYATV